MNQEFKMGQLGVTALTPEEEIELTGGIGWLLPALVAGLIVSAVNNFGDIRQGLEDGWNGTPSY
jgi:hypothetical protein